MKSPIQILAILGFLSLASSQAARAAICSETTPSFCVGERVRAMPAFAQDSKAVFTQLKEDPADGIIGESALDISGWILAN